MIAPVEVDLPRLGPAGSPSPRAIVLLDRDGVLNAVDPGGYVISWSRFRFLEGSLEALRRARASGFSVRVVSNQSCVGRGLADVEDVIDLMRRMVSEVAREGGRIDRVLFCPHHPAARCLCRKPAPAMLCRALDDAAPCRAPLVMIGDSRSDVAAGRAVGATSILLGSGETEGEQGMPSELVAGDLHEAMIRVEEIAGARVAAELAGRQPG